MDVLLEDRNIAPEQRDLFLENAKVDLDRLARMLDGLMALAKAEGPLHTSRVRLDEVAQAVANRFPTVQVVGTGAEVDGDAAQLEVLLSNLVENAAQHGKPPIYIRHFPDGFAVEDHGSGISPANQPHVFDRFFTTSVDRKGTGLGLALALAVAEAHGGSVNLEQAPQTTVFRVRFPAPAAGNSTTSSAVAAAHRNGTETGG
jgi:two-component system sensor histidine kinase MprB